MVRLEHANLVVEQIEPTLDFLLTAFPEWSVRGEGEMTWNGRPRRWLHVGDEDYYLTLNDRADSASRDLSGHSAGLAHIGFVVDDVKSLVRRLTDKGYQIDVEGQDHPYRRTFYFRDPAGFQFEFMQYLSEKPSERNSYDDTPTISVKRS